MYKIDFHVGLSPRITITHFTTSDKLQAESWVFSYQDRFHGFRVFNYSVLHRKTTRHKFNKTAWYDLLNKRDSTMKDYPRPNSEVIEIVKKEFFDRLQFLD